MAYTDCAEPDPARSLVREPTLVHQRHRLDQFVGYLFSWPASATGASRRPLRAKILVSCSDSPISLTRSLQLEPSIEVRSAKFGTNRKPQLAQVRTSERPGDGAGGRLRNPADLKIERLGEPTSAIRLTGGQRFELYSTYTAALALALQEAESCARRNSRGCSV